MRREQLQKVEPAYVRQWVGRRVSWKDAAGEHRGRCIDATMNRGEDGQDLRLRVVLDTGFVAPGVAASLCEREEESE